MNEKKVQMNLNIPVDVRDYIFGEAAKDERTPAYFLTKHFRSIMSRQGPAKKQPQSKFNFKAELKRLYPDVNSQQLDDWMKVRKDKKASNTETALKGIVREIEKSGKPGAYCIAKAAEKEWRGFEAKWLKDEGTAPTQNLFNGNDFGD